MTPRIFAALGAALVSAVALAGVAGTGAGASTGLPQVGHIFVINLENKGFDETWGPTSPATYLSQTLRSQGVLLNQYYGTGHESLDNYISQVSGQGPNADTQSDCQVFSNFAQLGTTPTLGQAIGQGCVYPANVRTVADEITARGLTWRGYMEDMGTPCRHPQLGALDDTQKAKVGDQYATRHDPFMYFHSVIDSTSCASNVVDYSHLQTDLSSPNTTANLTYITPNLCHDGHDAPCVDNSATNPQPGGLLSIDAWLQQQVPMILNSPAYKQDGMLVITFDESDGPQSDATACCGEGPGPNSPLPGITGMGGGNVGALVLSKWTNPNTTSTTPYNHYGLLRTIEDQFGLPYLGYSAMQSVQSFGPDVFNKPNN